MTCACLYSLTAANCVFDPAYITGRDLDSTMDFDTMQSRATSNLVESQFTNALGNYRFDAARLNNSTRHRDARSARPGLPLRQSHRAGVLAHRQPASGEYERRSHTSLRCGEGNNEGNKLGEAHLDGDASTVAR